MGDFHPLFRFRTVVAWVVTLWLGYGFAASQDRPNIVFIMTDDHTCQAISAYGSKLTTTPHIDRIAREGIRFDRCYVTNSICGPSRACILTGTYSHKNGYYCNDQEFNWQQPTFPRLLQEAGYQTAVVGKWHLGKQLPQGFDHWNILDHQGYYYQPLFIDPLGRTQHVGYVTDLITQYTLDWLKQGRDQDRPFFLMMNHKAPHRPWDPGPEQLEMFADAEPFPEPPTLFDDYEGRASAARRARMTIADDMATHGPDLKAWDHGKPSGAREWYYNKLTVAQHAAWREAYRRKNALIYDDASLEGKELVRWKYQRFLQDYLSCAAGVDASIGKLLAYLDEAGLSEQTVVIYCSDQGFFLGEHGWFDKRFMYEETLRTPLVIRWPAEIDPGRTEGRIVSNLDFAQTFLELAGAPAPPRMQGRSLVPILKGDTIPEWRDSFYYHYYEGADGGHHVCEHYGVTTGRYKLIHYYRIEEWELFDLEEDPHEVRNRYGDPAMADVQVRLREELQRLRAELEVPAHGSRAGQHPS